MRQVAVLSYEIDAATSLARHGRRILSEYHLAAKDAEAVFACLSGSAEKLLKLSLGIATVSDAAEWPTRSEMRTWGHRVSALDSRVLKMISDRQRKSTAPGLIAELLERVQANPGHQSLMAILERYAVNGRFHNLDVLGGADPHDEPPAELWGELLGLVFEANPDVFEDLAAGGHRWRQEVNRVLKATFDDWWELLRRCWMTGVFGSEALQWAALLKLE